MNDSASVTSSTLAVVEKTPRRKNGGCVGIFFQLFDWNKRFTKNKIFSKRLLPPDRAKDASKKFGGDDKRPRLKLIADENSGGFPNNNKTGGKGDQTPSLVARLMGLESMPPVSRDHLQKDDSGSREFRGDNGEFRPQKVQKTGMVDRRSVSRFGAEALQLKNVLSQSRKHHHPKLASPVKPVKSTGHHAKRNTSRLIGAATRILEPGLLARNKSRYVISYGQGARRSNGVRSGPVKGEDLDPLTEKTSCRSCGSFIDSSPASNISRDDKKQTVPTDGVSIDHGQRSLTNQHLPSTYLKEDNRDQLKFSSATKDLVALNRGLSGRIRPRGPGKGEDMKFESGRVNCLSSRPKRQAAHTKRQVESCGIVDSFGKQKGPEAWQPGYNGQSRNKNTDDGTTFRFTSPMKNMYEVPAKAKLERGKNNSNASQCKTTVRKRFASNSSGERICLQKRFPSTVAGYESGINRNQLKRRPTNICLQPIKSEKVVGLAGEINNDHHSPGSVLEASFSADSCCSSSLEDSSVRTQHADSMSYSYDDASQFQESETDTLYYGLPLRKENTHKKLVADLLTYISQVLCSMDVVNSRVNRNIKEVIFNSELVLSHQMPLNPNEINSFFICDLLLELDTLADVMWTRFGNFLGSRNSNARYHMKGFVFDSLIEYLESKYVQYSKCGFRAWMTLPRFMGFDSLVRDVVEEVRRWMCVTLDEQLLEMDMSHGSGKWLDFEIEAYEMGAEVEWDIVQMLIDEIVIDVSTGIEVFRV